MQASVVAMAVSPPLASVALLVALVALLLDRCLPRAPPPGWADYAGWAACTRAVAQVALAMVALALLVLFWACWFFSPALPAVVTSARSVW